MRPVGRWCLQKRQVHLEVTIGPTGHFSRHKLSKWRLILASDHPHLPLPLPLSLSLTMRESICQKNGQDKDQKVRFK